MHTNKKTKEIQDPVAKRVIENARTRLEVLQSQDPSPDGSSSSNNVELINRIVKEVTPKVKGRTFGLGNLSQCSDSFSSSGSFVRDDELAQTLREKDERIAALEKLVSDEKAERERGAADMERRAQAMEAENARRAQEMQDFMAEMKRRFPGL